ncbi:MAG: DNA-formamidopyrimidine glycosylase [Candidatus Levybacteria bacterium RIFCSPLOWO2_01_FULL_36_13]|nr:MAG: DNA-formamidopyrimidine glycosylase [Candidatus Levybacteria bacterium RIFCSPHIGHO2_01_FULL_36_15b]OGH34093.1 MAG: DNA-formamidopyrimidine glycosylase [Candidatus Levybacteria bacterium RIFCSPLOWO2_01_FULL_36_13]
MPELPEVETVKLGLQKYLVGHKIENVEVKVAKLFEGQSKDIIGAKVKDVRRFGKGLVIDLSNKYSLAIHIKLTGQLIYRDEKTSKFIISKKVGDKIPNQFTHVIFKLDKGAFLYYNDKRRFGWIRVVKTEDVFKMPFFKNMGPEPFKDLTLELFEKIISGRQTIIKPLLMDQTRIGGIGNIYANDALFLAGINPKRRAKDLSPSEIKLLYDSILKVMEKSMKYGGASELNFVNVLGQEGEYQHHSLAYGRQGEKCSKNDGGVIQKNFLAGRGTYFCPVHQK